MENLSNNELIDGIYNNIYDKISEKAHDFNRGMKAT